MSSLLLPALLCAPVLLVSFASQRSDDEILVTTDYIFDLEFEDGGTRFAWADPVDGDVWVSDVDPVTGDFVPLDGKGSYVDSDALFINNGPEWVGTTGPDQIVYTKTVQPSEGSVNLAEATFDGSSWTPSLLPNARSRLNPLASLDPDDQNPVIVYWDLFTHTSKLLSWRFLNDADSERHIPLSVGATGGRWVPGARAFVYTKQFSQGGERQAFLFDATTGVSTQMTFDSGAKETIFMWRAPDFDDEYVFFVSVKYKDFTELRLYRQADLDGDGAAEWGIVRHVRAPSSGVYFWSPEPFVHNGKSYIFTMATRSSNRRDYTVPNQIWLIGLDPEDPFTKNLSDPELSRVRLDPEVFVTEQGPMVYYNRYQPAEDTNPFVPDRGYEGIYRVDTGLGPRTR